MQVIGDYEAACHDLAGQGGTGRETARKSSELQHQLEMYGGWEIETNARAY